MPRYRIDQLPENVKAELITRLIDDDVIYVTRWLRDAGYLKNIKLASAVRSLRRWVTTQPDGTFAKKTEAQAEQTKLLDYALSTANPEWREFKHAIREELLVDPQSGASR